MLLKVPFKQLVFSVGFVAASLTLPGCAGLGGPQAPEAQTFKEGKSFAYNVSLLSRINADSKDRHIHDVEIENLGEIDLSRLDGSADLAGVGLGLGMLSFPSSIGSSGMNAFMALDLILGSAAGHPVLTQNKPVVAAWLPVDQASSPKDAMDKLHAIRLESIKKSLDEHGVKYALIESRMDWKVLPWNSPSHITRYSVEDHEGLCSVEEPCKFNVRTVMPNVRTVVAPKELTGQTFEAYFFPARDHLYDYNATDLILRDESNGVSQYAQARSFDNFLWLNKNLPAWIVPYVPALHPRALARVANDETEVINPFPYMVHNGEIKLFAVEKKSE